MNTNHLDEEQLYYKNKYLKYKNKYLVLKKELKGGQWWEAMAKTAGRTWGQTTQAVGDTVGHATQAIGDTVGHATKAGDAVIKNFNDGMKEQAQTQLQPQAQTQLQPQAQPQQLTKEDHYKKNNRIINFLVELILSQFCSNEISNTILNEKNEENETKCKHKNKNKTNQINTIIKCPDKYKNNNYNNTNDYNNTKDYIKLIDGKATHGLFSTSCVLNFDALESTTNVNNRVFHGYICHYEKIYSESRRGRSYDLQDFKLYNLSHNLSYFKANNQFITALEYLIDRILENFYPLVIVKSIASTKKYLVDKVKEFINSDEFSTTKTTYSGTFKDITRKSC
jgi:hypothetical protein